jgi:hypothetical protein
MRILVLGAHSLAQALIGCLNELGDRKEQTEFVIRNYHNTEPFEACVILKKHHKPFYLRTSEHQRKQVYLQTKKLHDKRLTKKGFGRFNNPFIY